MTIDRCSAPARVLPDLSGWSSPSTSSGANLWSYMMSSGVSRQTLPTIARRERGRYAPSSIADGCLNVATCMSDARYRTKSLSGMFIRFCRRFFVSENFSPWRDGQLSCKKVKTQRTYWSQDKAERNAMCACRVLRIMENVDDLPIFRVDLVDGYLLQVGSARSANCDDSHDRNTHAPQHIARRHSGNPESPPTRRRPSVAGSSPQPRTP